MHPHMKPLILLSNDDGVRAKGLNSLIEMLRPLGDLFVIAPDRGRSGASCSITTPLPITIKRLRGEEGLTVYSCTGTPADCVKLALDQLLMRQPDLVVGGINHGTNASTNAHYSGTVGVATEGALHGLPAIAYSLLDYDEDANFSPLTPYVRRIADYVLRQGMPYGSILNVNFPVAEHYAGMKVCRMGYSRWENEYTPCERPEGGRYFWLGGEFVDDEPDETDTDVWALDRDYVAITPLKLDNTDYQLLHQMENELSEDSLSADKAGEEQQEPSSTL